MEKLRQQREQNALTQRRRKKVAKEAKAQNSRLKRKHEEAKAERKRKKEEAWRRCPSFSRFTDPFSVLTNVLTSFKCHLVVLDEQLDAYISACTQGESKSWPFLEEIMTLVMKPTIGCVFSYCMQYSETIQLRTIENNVSKDLLSHRNSSCISCSTRSVNFLLNTSMP